MLSEFGEMVKNFLLFLVSLGIVVGVFAILEWLFT